MNSLTKVFAILIAVLLLYIFPISAAFDHQDDVSELVVLRTVTTFVDAVRDKGYISPEMYNDFFAELHATGNTFDIQMEHDHKRYDPVYDDPLNPATFHNEYAVHYDSFYNAQIMKVLFPDTTAAKDALNRRYLLDAGDYFYVTVKNTNRTNGTVLRDFLNNANSSSVKIFVPYGGMVRNADH
ncbi:hypothetical protein B5M42_020915 [Paenibacillus athensensis]|uniref:Uncharacterized protein n=1 Tax=Paenibacillus athensensis TaxID=1967502 RepID=A0A4Y8PYN0_9BACL|nr:hypothetical protein [Paenibacillus athensensis]MCD1261266.1 hypothetical protein [Paenibacillus athensensis]